MTKPRKTAIVVISGIIALGILLGITVERRIGDSMNVPDLEILLKTQPQIMPGMDLPKLGSMPDLEGLVAWINSPALSKEDLKGKVVLVDFWTYSCINCIRTFPYLKSWWGKYQDDDFILIGIHTPEFAFEKEYENVLRAVEEYGLTYPIALDNDYKTWRNFKNRFWPATYLFDKEGNLRYTHFGEGEYHQTEAAIQQLLGVEDEITEREEVDFSKVHSPETYLGWKRMERFASPEQLIRNHISSFTIPDLALNEWGLGGLWLVAEEYSESKSPGSLQFRFDASSVNIVAESDEPTRLQILLDGSPIPEDMRGHDIQINEQGYTEVTIHASKLYELIKGEAGEHLIEIVVPESGIRIYTLTFG